MKRLILLFIPMLLFQCQKESELLLNTTSADISILFETEISLQNSGALSLNDKSHIVHYKVMRNFAIQEIEKHYKEDLKITSVYTLSTYPIIIYNYDSKPAFYEFIIYDNANSPISTISTFANKETDDLIAFILPFVRDYSQYDSNIDFFIGLYPGNPYLGDTSNFGQVPNSLYDKKQNQSVNPLAVSDIDKLENLYNMLPEEDKLEIGNGKDEIASKIIQEQQDGLLFWNSEYSNFEFLISQTDDDIKSSVSSETTPIYGTPHYDGDAAMSELLQRTRWSVDCGPAVTAWIYRGLYTHYNGTFVWVHFGSWTPSLNNLDINIPESRGRWHFNATNLADLNTEMENQDGGLLHRIYQEGNTAWTVPFDGITYPGGMTDALKDITNDNYRYHYIADVYTYIKNHSLPTYRVVGAGGGSLHYVCIFAARKINGAKQFLVTDNGFTTGQNGNNHYSYWTTSTQLLEG